MLKPGIGPLPSNDSPKSNGAIAHDWYENGPGNRAWPSDVFDKSSQALGPVGSHPDNSFKPKPLRDSA